MNKKFKIKNLIILVLSVIFLIGFINQTRIMHRLKQEKKNQEAILEKSKSKNESLQDENNMVQTGEFIEKLAREKLNMLKPGESNIVDKENNSDSND